MKIKGINKKEIDLAKKELNKHMEHIGKTILLYSLLHNTGVIEFYAEHDNKKFKVNITIENEGTN